MSEAGRVSLFGGSIELLSMAPSISFIDIITVEILLELSQIVLYAVTIFEVS